MMKRTLLSLLALSLALNLAAIDRGLGNPNATYIEKGTFAGGISGSYRNWDADGGASLLGILTGLDGRVSYLSAGGHADWFIKDNLSLVASLDYVNLAVHGNKLGISDLLELSNKHYRRESYELSLGLRKYVPLFNSKILALFGEGRFTGSRGYGKSYELTERGKEGNYSDLYSLNLGVIIGLSVFVNDRIAVQFSLPQLTVGMDWDNQREKQERDSSITAFKLRDYVDPLGIRISTIFCF